MDQTAPPHLQLVWRRRFSTVGVVLGVLIGFACKTVPPKPAGLPQRLLTGTDPLYPQVRYVTGAGQGSDASQARAAAVAVIGAQLQAKIERTLVTREQAMTGPEERSTMLAVRNDVRQHTTFDHHGQAKVVDTQVKDGIVHVFAVLDRMAMAEPFLQDVSRLRDLLRRALEDFEKAAEKMNLGAASRLAKAVGKEEHELAVALVLAEATTTELDAEEEWSLVAKAVPVKDQLLRLRAQAVVEVCLNPAEDFPEGSQLVLSVIDQINALGVTAVACGHAEGRATFRVEGSIDAAFSADETLDDAVLCRPSLDLRLINVKSEAEMLSAVLGGDSAQAAGRDREVATRAALKKLAAACVPKLTEALGEVP